MKSESPIADPPTAAVSPKTMKEFHFKKTHYNKCLTKQCVMCSHRNIYI